MVPPFQVIVPVTVLVLISVDPFSIRLVIPPPLWKAGPKTGCRLPAPDWAATFCSQRQRRPGEFTKARTADDRRNTHREIAAGKIDGRTCRGAIAARQGAALVEIQVADEVADRAGMSW